MGQHLPLLWGEEFVEISCPIVQNIEQVAEMLCTFLLSLFFIPAALANAVDHEVNEHVTFNVVSSRSIEEPPTIQVTFANGVKDYMDLKHYIMNEVSAVGCNYIGRLRNDPTSSLAVTGCLNKPGDKMEITLISKNNKNMLFSVDFEGNAENLKIPYEEGAHSISMRVGKNRLRVEGDEVIDDEEEKRVASFKATSVPRKLKATIKFGFDQTLSDELGGRTSFDSWISEVFTHTQAHFRHSESLGTEIEFEVLGEPLFARGKRWCADNNLKDAKEETKA